MNKQELANKIWNAANTMRGTIDANDYKDYLIGLIFYKFLSDKEEQWAYDPYGGGFSPDAPKNDLSSFSSIIHIDEEKKNELDEETIEYINDTIEYIKNELGYCITYDDLFSTWVHQIKSGSEFNGTDFNGNEVTNALNHFDNNVSNQNVFGNKNNSIFSTIKSGIGKLGNSAHAITTALKNLITLVDEIPTNEKNYDVLGYIYENLIANFAADAGKKAGEFYTPHEVSVLISQIVTNYLSKKDSIKKDSIKIYDPTSGSASLLLTIGDAAEQYIDKDSIIYYAQELNTNTYNLTRMNLVMRGINPANIHVSNADTLKDDWPKEDKPVYVDAVVSNPPYSLKWDTNGKDDDERFQGFGIPPKSKADYAFLLHDLYHINHDGIVAIVLPHGVLFRGGEEKNIRKNLLEGNQIDTIISLPEKLFYGTGIPTIIMLLRKNRELQDPILFIDASTGYEKDGNRNKLRASDIKRIVDTINERRETTGYSRLIDLDYIRENGYNLNIPRYIERNDKENETYDIYASIFGGIPESELNTLENWWKVFPTLQDDLFEHVNSSYLKKKVSNLIEAVYSYTPLDKMTKLYSEKISTFSNEFKKESLLIKDKALKHGIGAEEFRDSDIKMVEDKLTNTLFTILHDIPLIDPYNAYQILDDQWTKVITPDLEFIASAPDQSTWTRKIFSQNLIEKYFFSDQYKTIENLQQQRDQIQQLYMDLVDQLPEEEKSEPFVNNKHTGFMITEAKKVIKNQTVDDDIINILQQAIDANTKDIELKYQIEGYKTKKNPIIGLKQTLAMNVNQQFDNLTNSQIDELLNEKWIKPLVNQLNDLLNELINDFIGQLNNMIEKYATPLNQTILEIQKESHDLSAMISSLVGNSFDNQALAEFSRILEDQ